MCGCRCDPPSLLPTEYATVAQWPGEKSCMEPCMFLKDQNRLITSKKCDTRFDPKNVLLILTDIIVIVMYRTTCAHIWWIVLQAKYLYSIFPTSSPARIYSARRRTSGVGLQWICVRAKLFTYKHEYLHIHMGVTILLSKWWNTFLQTKLRDDFIGIMAFSKISKISPHTPPFAEAQIRVEGQSAWGSAWLKRRGSPPAQCHCVRCSASWCRFWSPFAPAASPPLTWRRIPWELQLQSWSTLDGLKPALLQLRPTTSCRDGAMAICGHWLNCIAKHIRRCPPSIYKIQ